MKRKVEHVVLTVLVVAGFAGIGAVTMHAGTPAQSAAINGSEQIVAVRIAG